MVKESFAAAGKAGRCIPCLHDACRFCTNGEANKMGYGIEKCTCPCEQKEYEHAER